MNKNRTLDYTTVSKETTQEGIATTSSAATTTVDATTAFGLTVGDIYTSEFTLDRNDTNNGFSSTGKVVGFALEIHMTNVDEIASIHLAGGTLDYTALY